MLKDCWSHRVSIILQFWESSFLLLQRDYYQHENFENFSGLKGTCFTFTWDGMGVIVVLGLMTMMVYGMWVVAPKGFFDD